MTSTANSAERPVRILATIAGAAGAIVLVGWLFDIPRLTRFTTVWSAMTPLTAVLMILISLGLIWFTRRPRLANGFLIVAALLAVAVLAEYLFDLQLGLVPLTDAFRRGNAPAPELPAPDTSAAVVILVCALFCWRSLNRYVHDFADVVSSLVGVICLQVLIEYSYNLAQSAGHTGFRQVAPHTTASMMLVAAAVVARRPTPGLFAAMTGRAQSATLLRWLLPITLLLCVIAGWLQVLAMHERVGSTTPELVAWTITGIVVVLAILLFVTSGEMRKAESIVQRRQEELQAATMAAEAASETKSRFMAVMSHELRTPLTAVIGYADLLETGLAGELPQAARKHLQRIRSSSWHLVGMIDAVLLYAGGRLPAAQSMSARVDLGEMVRELLDSFSMQAREKNLLLTLKDPAQPLVVTTDPHKLRQILLNLLSNAVKFTAHGSVMVEMRAAKDRIAIAITDTGPGIDPDHLVRIWEPFELVDDTHTRTQGGMGLGLALSHRLAQQLGARIGVSSTVGKGTTFTLELPIPKSEITNNEVQLTGTRILVVDDEAPVRRIMARALARHGPDVHEAASAQEALEQLKTTGGVDVLVTDISMPGMSGIDLARTLRTQGDSTPVLFVTGAHLDEKDEAAVAQLGDKVLRKPFDMAELARVVNRVIHGS